MGWEIGDQSLKERDSWPEFTSELYRPSYRRLLAKLVPAVAVRGCHIFNVTDTYGRILGFLDRPTSVRSKNYSLCHHVVLTLTFTEHPVQQISMSLFSLS
jgi:hypothetical protein